MDKVELTPQEFTTLTKDERDAYYKQRICVPTPSHGAAGLSRVQFLQLYHSLEQYTSVLDIGCHDGFATRWMAEDPIVTCVVGVEPGDEAVRWARKLAPNEKAIYYQGTWEDVAEDAGMLNTFDCVVAFELVEHFTQEEATALIKFMHRKLTPGGRAFISTPDKHGPYGEANTEEKEHLMLYTKDSLAALVEDAVGCTPEIKLSSCLLMGTWQA